MAAFNNASSLPFLSNLSTQISIVDFFLSGFTRIAPTIQQLRAGSLNSDASFLCICGIFMFLGRHVYEYLWQLVHNCLAASRFSENGDSRKPPSQENAVSTSPSASRGMEIQDLDISSNQTKTPPNAPNEGDAGRNRDSEKPPSTWDFSVVTTGNIDTLEEYTQKTDRASKLVQKEGPCTCRLEDSLGKRSIDTMTPPSSSTSEAGEEQSNEASGTIQASKLEYKRVDEIWNEKEGKFKIVEWVGSDLDKLDEFLFVVRERTDKNTLERTSYIDIKSPWIRDILREICENVRGVSLADSKPSIELNAIFHVRSDLQQQREVISRSSEGSTAEKHLEVFLRYLEAAFRPTDERLSELLKNKEITYDLLWALFKPNVEVYTTCKGTQVSRCLLYSQMEGRKDMAGSQYIHIETRYLGSDGKALGEVTSSSSIPIFRGATRIDLLPAYPLQYHPEKDEIRRQLEECGRRFVSLLGIHHQQYKGRAFDYDEDGNIVAYHVEGNIMVDSECFQENMPNYPCPRPQKVRPQWSVLGRCEAVKLVDIDPEQLKPEDFLICSPTILGFSLEMKRFLEFAVKHVTNVQWSECSFQDVNIPEGQKKAIYALTKTYLNRGADDAFHDFVQGKGRGINFLLYGPPGVGKTLTAETLAETFKVPLYTVAAGQIGVDHIRVEKILKSIFKIASRWGAILLLDEADVFLAERSLDPHTNALVSVFLRELEHYEGILFLTTNRMNTFDVAILSRIHLPLKYEPLKKDAREGVWLFFIKQARTTAGHADYDDNVISDLAEKKLNGREIRNTVFIARSMAEYDGKVVNETYLRESIETRKQLDEDFQGAGAIENNHSYF